MIILRHFNGLCIFLAQTGFQNVDQNPIIRYCIWLTNSLIESESVWKSLSDVLTKYYSISEDTLTWTAQICLGQRLNKFPLLILMTHMIWVISITQLLTHKSWVLDIDTSGGIFDRPEATSSNCFSFMWLDNFWCFCEIILLGQEQLLAFIHRSGKITSEKISRIFKFAGDLPNDLEFY